MTFPWSSFAGDIPVRPSLDGFLVGELVHNLRKTSPDVLVDARLNDGPQGARVSLRIAGYLSPEDSDRLQAVVQLFVAGHSPQAKTRTELSTLYVERTQINSTIAVKEAQLAMQEAACTSKELFRTLAVASTPPSSTAVAA